MMQSAPLYQLQWQQLQHPVLSSLATEVWLASINSSIVAFTGNKCLKLKYHIRTIEQGQKRGILSFGGAFSNHLAALAAAGKQFGFATLGLVRTHSPIPDNPTLNFCRAQGMQLIALDRQQYRRRNDADFLHELAERYPSYVIVPEGGSDDTGIAGAASLCLQHTPAGPAQQLVCATGSGGTLAGLCKNFYGSVTGVDVVGDPTLPARLQHWLAGYSHWQLKRSTDHSRYGDFEPQTLEHCQQLLSQGVLLEPIYTGKAWRSLLDWLQQGVLPAGQRYVLLHSGGLQGLAGLAQRQKISAEFWRLCQPLLVNSAGLTLSVAPTVD